MGTLVSILLYALDIYATLVVIRVLLSWFPGAHRYPLVRLLYDVTDPLLAPLAAVIPSVAGVDFSPMALLFLLWGAQELLRMTLSL